MPAAQPQTPSSQQHTGAIRLTAIPALAWVLLRLLASSHIANPASGQLQAILVFSAHQYFLTYALCGAFLIHVWIRPSPGFFYMTVLMGSAFAAAHILLGGEFPRSLLGAFLGIASLLVLTIQVVRSRAHEVEKDAWIASTTLVGFVVLSYPLNRLTAQWQRETFDGFLYSFDAGLGFQPSFLVGRAFQSHPLLAAVSSVVYDGLPLLVAFLYCLLTASGRRARLSFIALFIAAGIVGPMFYPICPAAGPRYLFPNSFPISAPQLSTQLLHSLAVPGARNCMPSLHMAWALLLLYATRRSALWVQLFFALCLALTFLATLGIGQHYLIDLFVAVPFFVAMQAAGTMSVPLPINARWRPILLGFGLTLVWPFMFRFCTSLLLTWPVTSWVLAFITALVPLTLLSRLNSCQSPIVAE